jgi:mannose-1-phosphate guanylyltransferase / mannose-6-phosphate isomerase
MNFHPVILSGGSGARLWPLSRAAMPKQLLALAGEDTLLQATTKRAAAVPGAQPAVMVCNETHRFLVKSQLEAISAIPDSILLEPCARNTAAAVAIAALKLAESDPHALMLVLPADHLIDDHPAFAQAVALAMVVAQAGYLVTFGVTPHLPETGYGYIQAGLPIVLEGVDTGARAVRRFVEKPDAETAQRYIAEEGYTWNSGIFVFTAARYLEELQTHRPDILSAVALAWHGRTIDLGFCRPDAAAFAACPSDSIDYAVMQVTQRAAVVPASFGWSDVGSWDSLWQVSPQDDQGNVIQGDVFCTHTRNAYIRAEKRHVAVIGLDDIVVVETADAVLVMHRSKAQHVKAAVGFFEANGRKEHLEHVRVYRPWGWYECVDNGPRFQVKRIQVNPGGKLSLQMHHHRAEHWIVVSGTAKVTVNGEEKLLKENQSTYIPLGQTHRLENPGKNPLQIIEVQSGEYLGEDDIVRFEDTYGRQD